MIQLTGCMILGRTDRMVCNSINFNVVLTLSSMIFDHCSFHEDNSFCIYCLTKMTIPKVTNRVHELKVCYRAGVFVEHAHSSALCHFSLKRTFSSMH